MAAVHSTTIPCEPYTAHKLKGKSYFFNICLILTATCMQVEDFSVQFDGFVEVNVPVAMCFFFFKLRIAMALEFYPLGM